MSPKRASLASVQHSRNATSASGMTCVATFSTKQISLQNTANIANLLTKSNYDSTKNNLQSTPNKKENKIRLSSGPNTSLRTSRKTLFLGKIGSNGVNQTSSTKKMPLMCQPQNIPFKAWENTVLNKPRTSSIKATALNSEVLLTSVPRKLTHVSIRKFENGM